MVAMVKAIHSMTHALDEARSLACCEQAFDLTFAEPSNRPNFTRVYLRNCETEIETTRGVSRLAICAPPAVAWPSRSTTSQLRASAQWPNESAR
jgi:hypothetical protein